MARLLAAGGVALHGDSLAVEKNGSGAVPGPGRPAAVPVRRDAPETGKRGRNAKSSRAGVAALFTDLPRPDRPAPKSTAKEGKTRKSVENGMKGAIKLVAPRPARLVVKLSEADWKGAHDERVAEAVAGKLRAEGTRLRAHVLFKRLPPSLRPGTAAHAPRDLQKAVAGSKIRRFQNGWFWFHGEDYPKERPWRVESKDAERRARGEQLWWRVAHTIALLDRGFTYDEMKAACGEHLSKLAEPWLRLRLIRARDRNPPFLKFTPPDVYQWTGLDPAEVVKED